jgi:hypothetical protein
MENMDNFEFDSFMDNSNSEFEKRIEEFRQSMLEKAIELNYEKISKHGILERHLREMSDIELGDLSMTLEKMIKHYEDLEMYERCALLVKHLRNVNQISLSLQD